MSQCITTGYEREYVNNQKRIIRELKRIGDALEELGRRRITANDTVTTGYVRATNIDKNETEEE